MRDLRNELHLLAEEIIDINKYDIDSCKKGDYFFINKNGGFIISGYLSELNTLTSFTVFELLLRIEDDGEVYYLSEKDKGIISIPILYGKKGDYIRVDSYEKEFKILLEYFKEFLYGNENLYFVDGINYGN